MTVFYSIYDERGTRDYCFTRYLGNIIFDEIDISYWVVPGTITEYDENMI